MILFVFLTCFVSFILLALPCMFLLAFLFVYFFVNVNVFAGLLCSWFLPACFLMRRLQIV